MNTVGSYEAKTHLPRLLDRVAQGEQITITKRGVPIAMLVPVASPRGADAASVIRELRAFRKGRRLGKLSLRKMIEEGRRF